MSQYKWVSWIQDTDDYRPLNYPPNESVLGWWCTGYDVNDIPTMCAMVKAKDEEEARKVIATDWPELGAQEWRIYKEANETLGLSNRFPLSDWSQERFDKARGCLT